MKYIALVFLTAFLSAQLYCQDTTKTEQTQVYDYFHDIQFGVTFASTEIGVLPFMELSTSHGFYLSKRFSACIGVATIYFMTLTPYIQGRLDFAEQKPSKRSIPYASLRAGYLLYFDPDLRDENSINIEPSIGYSFMGKKGKSSWAVFIAANCIGNRVFPKIGVGFEF